MNNRSLNDKVKHYFATHPESKECFVTSDELIFHKDTDAEAHARSLAEKEVAHVKRSHLAMLDLEQEAEEEEELPSIGTIVHDLVNENVQLKKDADSEAPAAPAKEEASEEPAKEEAPAAPAVEAFEELLKVEAPKAAKAAAEKKSKGTNSKNG